MKGYGVVFVDKGKVEYQEVTVPELGSRDIVIDVEHSWISIGTESSFLKGERIAGEVPYLEGDALPFPQINGYQKVGKIRALGDQVEGFQAGERVFATVSKVKGMAFSEGGHVSPAVTDVNQVWKIPDGMSPVAFAGLVLTQVGYNCGSRPPVKEGDQAVVIGDGLVGQWAAQTLIHRGAKVTVLGRHEDRLALLPDEAFTMNTSKNDASEQLSSLNPDLSIIVDTVGSLTAVYECLPYLRHNGHLVSAGFLGTDGRIDIQSLREKEVTLHNPSGWDNQRMNETIRGIEEGWLQTETLITHQFPAEQATEAWKLISDKNKPCLGVVLNWDRGL